MNYGTTLLTANEQLTVEYAHLPDPIPCAGNGCSRLFLLSVGSGDSRECRRLAQCLGGAYAVSLLRAGGCGRDEAGSVEHSAQHAFEAILLAQSSGPCLVGGIREGGIVAFATARRLERHGRSVRLVLFDTPLPGGGGRFTPLLDTFKSLKRHLARYFRSKAGPPHPDRAASFAILHFLPEEGENALHSHSRLGWERLTSAATDVVYLHGNNESLLVEANLRRIGSALKHWNTASQ